MKTRVLMMLTALILLYLAQMAVPPVASACGPCIPRSPKQHFDNADAVFMGKVIGSAAERHETNARGVCTQYSYLFEVSSQWKGVISTHIYTYADFDCDVKTDCDELVSGFEVGRAYLVYASRTPSDGKLRSYLGGCYITSELENASEALRALGPGKAPNERVGMPVTGSQELLWYLLFAILGSLSLVLGISFKRIQAIR
jgi:hypothetical protein